LRKESYEAMLHELIPRAEVVDHSKSPCEENFIPTAPEVSPSP
jgi:beta-1,2-N-acetylglucosaminyltransferase